MESEMTNRRVFTKEFTRQERIPEAGIQRALELMQSGRLHRYNTADGEESEVALLEKEYAEYVGARYCVALNSCGSAMYVALKSVGVKPGDRVLCNAFTLAPVPGAIVHAGAEVVLVEIGEDYVIDLDDLEKKAEESGAGYFLISHMRGHVADMDAVVRICDARGIRLVEDCAHTMGCRWGEHHTGTFGKAGCFSTQTYKHMNSGEGGLLITDDDDVIARAILYSGSYMFYEAHISRPSLEVFERHKAVTPNFSLRMSNFQAAVLRPQLKALESTCARWNQRYALLERELNRIHNISVPTRHAREFYVGSSIQFTVSGFERERLERFIVECGRRGVEIKWFGWKEPRGFTSSYKHWQYMKRVPDLPGTEKILDCLCDFRIPLTFTLEDCELICRIIEDVMVELSG